ncbi:mismatch-specific DNA-glycosylase [Oleiagrimonas sp.]|jgi:TDG/mug DNA glycosylase family protein|uniref:mismatch-specific DNA-glycosylase n=1 Tax=Oleiagrimonas sp. TaxID=2010330 RepID=UPI0026238AE8|nr:mismatch-specific DNA-glycosylase [Oleiagrimonas sp.]MDA3914746.1 mismatch-specific DNA-glycosylase [Oleiagrimonas sp.]
MPAEHEPILPDMLRPGLRLVFCGTAASRRSARERAYYAHPGNAFWRTLHQVGITPRRFDPGEFPQLLALGIGLTDLAKHHSGNDNQLPAGAFDVDALRERISRAAPQAVAFTSKNAARAVLGRGALDYGWHAQRLGETRLYVLPSPSGQARAAWRIEPWQDLSNWLARSPRDMPADA